jgi:serine/threonine protein kinase
LGDVLDKRFIVIHKLGYGQNSTIWLVQSLENPNYFAIKIFRADLPHPKLSVLEYLSSADVVKFPKLHETFTIHGPNGTHQCLVLDVGGPSIRNLHTRLPLEFAATASIRLAEVVACLHSVDVCHGGKF